MLTYPAGGLLQHIAPDVDAVEAAVHLQAPCQRTQALLTTHHDYEEEDGDELKFE